MNKPNLFIVGSPKCGTTFFCEKLKEHPDLFFPKIKELNYFSYNQLNNESYYRDYKVNSLEKYLEFYKNVKNEKYLVDASVSYFTFENIPSKIKTFNPKSKIIILVRNPYKRSYSHYIMDKRMGHANKSLQEYLYDKKSFHYRQYIKNSKYFEQVKNYEKHFKSENILILELEKFESKFNDVFKFLEIKPINIDFDSKVNENKIPANNIGRFVQKNRGFIERLKLTIPKKVVNILKKIIYNKAPKTEIPQKDLNLLKSIISSDYRKFETQINNES